MLKTFRVSLKKSDIQRHLFKVPLFLVCLILASTWLVPIMVPNQTQASQLVPRQLAIASGVPGATSVTYTYTFTTITSAAIQGIKMVACTTAVGTYGQASTTSVSGCTVPTGININNASSVSTPGTGWTSATAFTYSAAGAHNCNPSVAGATNNVLCLFRAVAGAETPASKVLSITLETNPTTANSTFYVGIYLYSDASTYWNTPTDSGTVAAAVVQTLTITAAVAEILVFCVGSTSVDDATTAVGSASSCSGTTIDLGTLDPTAINYPITNGTSPNNKNGVAILRTNAVNGSSVYFDAIQDGTGTTHQGALRILGANCTTVPGSCITSKASQGVFTAGTQDFGVTIAGTNCGTETAGAYYSCVFGSGTEHLKAVSPYIGNTTSAFCSPTNCNGNNGFIWDESGTSDQIATATSTNVVADEALILKFAATPSITNTFGGYTAKADFTAVPTF